MASKGTSSTNRPKQLGFHYYEDTDHYDEASLDYWLPKLQAAGTRWLVLSVTENVEIPENFIQRIAAAGIEPVITLGLALSEPLPLALFRERVAYYRKSGAHLIRFFDHPNMKEAWSVEDWLKPDLVERFVALFVRYAEICLSQKMIPLFPLLQPGGDYWDISFLKASLKILKTQHNETILPNIIFSADAGFQEHPLDWGAGGPASGRFTAAYHSDHTDHKGFHIYEWYQAVLKQELNKTVPMILFHSGRWSDATGPFDISPKEAKQQLVQVLSMLQQPGTEQALPSYVVACNLYKLPVEFMTNKRYQDEAALSGRVNRGVMLRNVFHKEPQVATQKIAKSVSSEIGELFWRGLSAVAPFFYGEGKKLIRIIAENFVKIVRSLIAIFLRGENFSTYFLLPDTESLLTEEQREIINRFSGRKNIKTGKNLNEALTVPKVILLNDISLYPKNIIRQLRFNNCQIHTVSVSQNGKQ